MYNSMYNTKLFDIRDAIHGVQAWASSEAGGSVINKTGLVLQILGAGITLAGSGVSMYGRHKKAELLIDKEALTFDEEFSKAATNYLKSSARLHNEAEIRAIVKNQIEEMGLEEKLQKIIDER